ncbi:hypothetical protein F4X10_09035 [Candidatus Poribacteria bacterium]|nr:hypothetical protein [Candidatus Poribacteria bacterium]
MSVTTKNWVLKTVEKLSAAEIEKLRCYLEYLVWKSEIPKPEPTGQPSHVLAAINRSHQVSIEDAEALLQSIKEGEIPMRFDSAFEESESVTDAC